MQSLKLGVFEFGWADEEWIITICIMKTMGFFNNQISVQKGRNIMGPSQEDNWVALYRDLELRLKRSILPAANARYR